MDWFAGLLNVCTWITFLQHVILCSDLYVTLILCIALASFPTHMNMKNDMVKQGLGHDIKENGILKLHVQKANQRSKWDLEIRIRIRMGFRVLG